MKTLLNKYYVDYPLHFYSVEKIKKEFEFTLYNEGEVNVEKVTFLFGKQKVEIDLHSDQKVIKCRVKTSIIDNANFTPSLYSCMIHGKEFLLSNYKDIYTIKSNDSIFILGPERYLYTQTLAKNVKKPRKKIQFIATHQQYYWTCTCGNYNLDSFDTCTQCGNKKKDVFRDEVPIDEAADKRIFDVRVFKGAFFWLLITYIVQLAYQSLMGDFLFENLTKNDFFPVLNRLILPTLLLAVLIGMLITTSFYQKIVGIVLKIVFLVIIVYLNIIISIQFVYTAYNLWFVISVDFMILGMAYHHLREKRLQIVTYVMTGFALLSLGLLVFQWQDYGKYNLIVEQGGIRLNVETDATDYTIPSTIDNSKVIEAYFNKNLTYQIENLTISDNVENILIYSTAVLPKLDTITVSPNNSAYYISDTILYKTDGSIKLVPMSTETLTIDSDTVAASQFRDLYNLKAITIGPNVKTIEAQAFANDVNLKTIIFSGTSTLESIGANAFVNCHNLEMVTLPISIRSMGMGVFEGCTDLTYLKTPFLGEEREITNDLTKSTDVLVYMFGSRTWLDYELIPNSLETVDVYDIDRIHNVTFYNAKYVRNITLPDQLLYMGKSSLYGTESLQSFTVPDGVTSIDSSCFEDSGIASIIIPASVTQIDDNAFKNCINLTSVTYLGDINDLQISSTGNQALIDALNP